MICHDLAFYETLPEEVQRGTNTEAQISLEMLTGEKVAK